MEAVPIADPDDPRIGLYRGVRDAELLRDHGVFIAEGRLVVQRLLDHPSLVTRSVLVTPAARESLRPSLDAAPCPVYLATRELMIQLTGFNIHRGCLAIGERPAIEPIAAFAKRPDSRPLVVLEHVGNPDNVGGVFRNAHALGAAGIVLSPGCGDPFYRKAIRTSMAAALVVPFTRATDWPEDLRLLKNSERVLVALTPDAGADPIDEAIGRLAGSRVALLFGHEGAGLSEAAVGMADIRARIPMAPGADSLNVAAASAIALHAFRADAPGPPSVQAPEERASRAR